MEDTLKRINDGISQQPRPINNKKVENFNIMNQASLKKTTENPVAQNGHQGHSSESSLQAQNNTLIKASIPEAFGVQEASLGKGRLDVPQSATAVRNMSSTENNTTRQNNISLDPAESETVSKKQIKQDQTKPRETKLLGAGSDMKKTSAKWRSRHPQVS